MLGADDGGEAALTYTWQTTGTPPASVSFSTNGTNSAKNTTATFTKAGSYTFQVTLTDAGGLTVTSSVSVNVNQTVTSISVAPADATVNFNSTQQFVASAADQFGNAMTTAPAFAWAVSGGGTIDANGLFKAGNVVGGPFDVTASAGGKTGTAKVKVADGAPTVATAASANPNPVTGTQTNLSVLGADDGGEGNLTYLWSTVGTPPATVKFGENNSNAAKNSVANFTAPGTYNLQVTIKDAQGLTATSSVAVNVTSTFASISVMPTTPTVNLNGKQQFSATAKDQFGVALANQPQFTWNATGDGTIDQSGLFTAGATPGVATVSAASNGKSGNASVSVVDAPPTVKTVASANPSPVVAKTTTLSVVGDDDGGEAGLTYTWDLLGTPPAPVTFSINGSNAAQTTVATFTVSGNYNFRVTITDASQQSVISMVLVPVNQTVTSISVLPANATVNLNGTQPFSATELDQFGKPVVPQPAITWTVAGGGTIDANGVFTAGNTAGGPFDVTATSGTVTGTAKVTVASTAPTITVAASATPNPVIAKQTNLSVRATDDGGEPALKYTWDAGNNPPAPVTFDTNGTNAAKDSVATFTVSGTYNFQVTVTDATGLMATSFVVVVVNQTFTSIAVSPANATVNLNGTQQFNAVAIDQFGFPLGNQPAFTWSVDGGGSVSAGGLFTAGNAPGGPFNVAAAANGKTGTAQVTVVNAAPTVATAAAATPNPVAGTQTALSVLGADDGGEANLTYAWTANANAPAPVTFSANNSNAAKNTTATFSKAGAYTFSVTITDAGNKSVSSSVDVLVNPTLTTINVSPAVATVNLNGTQQFTAALLDQFGAAMNLQPAWTVTGGGSISAQGLFTAGATSGGVFTVKASNGNVFGTASVSIVNAAPTIATAAAATPNPVLDATTTVLSVLGADDGGEANLTYTWQATTGPAAVAFSTNGSNAAKTTTATFTKSGLYSFKVTAFDGNLSATSSVDVLVNQSPVVKAGANQTVRLPAGIILNGTATDDGIPNPPGALTVSWSKVTGPGTVTFTNASSTSTGAKFSDPGTYVLRLTASDSQLSSTSDVTITVNAKIQPPVVSAGPDHTVALPTATALNGTVQDDSKAPLTVTWSKVNGPSNVTFADATAPATSATFSGTGIHTLRLTVSNGTYTSTSDVSITVLPATNQPPVVSAGPTQSIALPNVATLNGTITDDGLPNPPAAVTAAWTKVSGPGTVTFGAASAAVTTAAFDAPGKYVLRLSGSDSQLTSSADVVVTVSAANQAPIVTAGADQTIRLPLNAVTLQGGAVDDGLPNPPGTLTYAWTKLTGPGTVTFSNPTLATTTATFSAAGVYTLQLAASDSLLTGTGSINITVKQGNAAPVVTTGPDVQTVFLKDRLEPRMDSNAHIVYRSSTNQFAHIDYYPPADKIMISANYPSGEPYNLEFINPDGTATPVPNVHGLTGEIDFHTVPETSNGTNVGGFTPGDIYTTTGVPGVIARIHAGTFQVDNPWVTIPNQTNVYAQFIFDNVGTFGGNIIFVSQTGDIWRISSAGVATFVANKPLGFLDSGVPDYTVTPMVCPNDPRYGPAAGKLLVSGEQDRGPMTMDTQGAFTLLFATGDAGPETYTLISPNQNCFSCSGGIVSCAPSTAFQSVWGEILSFTGYLHWDGTKYSIPPFGVQGSVGGEVTLIVFAPCGVNPVPATAIPISAAVTDDGFPNPPGKTNFTWSKVSGPGAVTFINPNAYTTSAVISTGGTYVIRATADDSDLTGSHDFTIYANESPLVNAGPSQTIDQSQTLALNGSVSDDGLPLNGTLICGWSKVNGPGKVTFTNQGFNAAADFALHNPNGVWSYGTIPATGAYVFTPLTIQSSIPDRPGEVGFNSGGGSPPYVGANPTYATLGTDSPFAPELLELSSGSQAFSTLRWTAPSNGVYLVQGRFQIITGAGDLCTIKLNSSTSLFSTQLSVVSSNLRQDFYIQRAFSAGDTLDFTSNTSAFLFGTGVRQNAAVAVTITDSSVQATTTAKFSAPGTYLLRLTADDGQLFSNDYATINVLAANTAPLVNAGPDQTVAFPATVSLSGQVFDDGLPNPPGTTSLAWSMVSGPGVVTFTAPNAASTQATFSVAGTYTLRLTANDGALVGTDDVVINSTPPNLAPTVDAGPDRATAPNVAITIAGKAFDDGLPNPPGALTLTWTKVSGPGTVTFNPPNAAVSNVTFSTAGTYVLQLSAFDGALTSTSNMNVTVYTPGQNNPPFFWNQPPVDQTIQLGTPLPLNVLIADDGNPAPPSALTVTWSKVSGPGTITFSPASQTIPWSPGSVSVAETATFSAAGTYIVRMAFTDSQLASGADFKVTVLPPANQAPTASAGVNQVVELGTAALLHGTASDDGLPKGNLTYSWTAREQFGQQNIIPGAVFSNPNSLDTTLKFPSGGDYIARLAVSDGQLTTTSEVVISVILAGNAAPVVIPPPDQTITLPTNTVTLTPTITDDGQPNPPASLTLQWAETQGPANGSVVFGVTQPNGQSTATFDTPGTYTLRITADDTRLSGAGYTHVTVLALNKAPVVSAAPSTQSIPQNSVANLTATASDDGLPANPGALTYAWAQVSGPGTAVIANPNALSTTATFPASGVYTLSFTASDGQLASSANVQVLVTAPAVNKPPVVSAGPSSTIRLPQNSANLIGSASDDGLPNPPGALTFTWSALSVPTGGTVTFVNSNAASTSATFSKAGLYTLQLAASDGALTGTAKTTVRVYDPLTGTSPTVSIDSLQVTNNGPTFPNPDGAELTAPTDVYGSVSAGDWTLAYAPVKDPDNIPTSGYTTFATGSGAMTNAKLGQFDPTLLLNGSYSILLTSTLSSGESGSAIIGVVCEKNLKVGNFSVAFNDCTIPIAGLPITVTRTYDTRAAGISSDFGYGWRLAIADIRLEKTANLGKFWFQQGDFTNFLGAFSMVEGKSHKITITFPDGKVYKFQGSITPGKQFASAIDGGTYTFTPIQPTLGKLTVVGSNDILVNGAPDEQNTFVPVTLQDFHGNIFNPTTFQLVTQEGMTYVIDQFTGLKSMTDLNGNTITVTPNGLISSTGKSIVFERDGANRITKITDCAGNPMYYNYDGSGNLISFTDRVGNTSQFTFDNTHKLISIIDPRGITPATNQYDDSGRLQSTTDALGHSIVYGHDLPGRTSTVTDRNGNPTTYAYDNDGNVLAKIDALGAETDYTYDLNDNQLTMKDPLGHVWKKDYDDFNNVLHDIDPLGHTSAFTYDNTRHFLTMTDPNGNKTTNTYDYHNNLQTVTDPLGNVTTYGYDYVFNPVGDPVSMIDANGKLWQYGNDNYGNRTSITDPDNHVVQYQFDSNNNRTQIQTTRTNGTIIETLTTSTIYDNNGKPVLVTYPDKTTTQTQYNSIGLVYVVKNELGYPTQYDYDNLGRLETTTFADGATTTIKYDNENRISTNTDQNGNATNYNYDAVGQLKKTTFADNTFTSAEYDLAGRVMDTTDQRGYMTQYEYYDNTLTKAVTDAMTNKTSFDYDYTGNCTAMHDANGHTTSYTYDGNGRLTKTTLDDGTFTEVQYDSLGRKQYSWDQGRKQTQYVYDNENRLVKITEALGNTTNYGYDEVGEQISQTDANNDTTRYEYDFRGRRVKRMLPLGMVEQYHYDDAGNRDSRTDFNGRQTSYVYDKLNRLLTKNPDPAFQAVQIMYDYWPTGKRKAMTDASGKTQYFYDGRNRLLSQQTPEGTLTYQYDAAGNVSTVRSSNPNGVSNDYSYDALNRLSTVLDNRHNATTTYGYDNVGNLLGYSYPNGVQTNLSYDSLNRLLTIGSTQGQAISGYSYSLGAAGNRLSVLELSNRLVKYDYDDLYRLKAETISSDSSAANNGTISYQYDSVGNRLSRSSSIGSVASSSNSFDQNDHLNTDQYDNNGNTIASNGNFYVYDFENRIISSNNGAISIVYDGDGNRVFKTVNGITTTYLVDTNNRTGYPQVVEELINSIVQRVYTYGDHLISQDQLVNAAWTQSFYGYDGHGSVRFLTNGLGKVTDNYDYDAFGIMINRGGATPNVYLYGGEQFDSDLGLYYLRSRYVNTNTGRFMTSDSYEGINSDPKSLHKYLYCSSNPINQGDPSGHLGSSEEALATLAIIALVTVAVIFFMAAVGHFSQMVYEGVDPWSPTHQENVEFARTLNQQAPASSPSTSTSTLEEEMFGPFQSHHIIQNAAAKTAKPVAGRPTYDYDTAPTILLQGPSTRPGTPHYRATQAQRVSLYGGSYFDEKCVAIEALIAAAVSVTDLDLALTNADKYFEGSLGWLESTPLDIPGDRRGARALRGLPLP